MFIGAAEFPRKVWLNGALVYNYPHYIDSEGDSGTSDYQDFFPITLQKGKNVLLVSHVYKAYREISFFAGICTWHGIYGGKSECRLYLFRV